MLYCENNTIRFTRGDTAFLEVNILYEDGSAYEIAPDDTLYLSVKQRVKDAEPCLQKKTVGTTLFEIKPEDTKNCAFVKYVYDVQLVKANGEVYTVIGPECFEILPEVTCI